MDGPYHCIPVQRRARHLHALTLLQVLSKGNILAFLEPHQAAEEEYEQVPNTGPLRPPVASTVVSTRGAGAAASAAREGSVSRERSNGPDEHLAEQGHTDFAEQIPNDVVQETEPEESRASQKGVHEPCSRQGVNFHTAACSLFCNACT
jgi:hypothetical protein